MKIVEVLIEHSKYSLNRPFSYVYFGDKKVDRGYRVLVSFNHQELVGYVTKVEESNKTVSELENELGFEINGAAEVMSKVNDDRIISFFLMPPNLEALESRIRRRKTESEEVIQERLNKGKLEMTMTDQYDYVILNDDVARASQEIVDLIKAKIKK